MTREQASEVIAMTLDQIATQIMDAGEIDAETKQGLRLTIEAFTMARTALRSGWVRTADRMPTESDGEYVIAQNKHGYMAGPDVRLVDIELLNRLKEDFTHWMSLPKLPEAEW